MGFRNPQTLRGSIKERVGPLQSRIGAAFRFCERIITITSSSHSISSHTAGGCHPNPQMAASSAGSAAAASLLAATGAAQVSAAVTGGGSGGGGGYHQHHHSAHHHPTCSCPHIVLPAPKKATAQMLLAAAATATAAAPQDQHLHHQQNQQQRSSSLKRPRPGTPDWPRAAHQQHHPQGPAVDALAQKALLRTQALAVYRRLLAEGRLSVRRTEATGTRKRRQLQPLTGKKPEGGGGGIAPFTRSAALGAGAGVVAGAGEVRGRQKDCVT